jgi:23S rRNA pseudouridine1911/1915/1917 synthase
MSKPPSGGRNTPSTVYHLGPRHAGLTLAAALKELVAETSWSTAKQWIARRQVQVNGNLCLDEARRVSEKDVIKLFDRPLPRPVQPHDLRVVHLDEHLLVVEKPAGVTSVRHVAERTLSTRRRQLQPTLEELLPPVLAKLQHLRWPPLPPIGMNKGKKKGGPKFKQPPQIHNAKKLPVEYQVIPVHRLDRDTSGLMLFARSRAAEQKLTGMFRRHTISREYVGVCVGHVAPQTIESQLVRDRGDGIRGSLNAIAAPTNSDAGQHDEHAGQRAVTHIFSAEHFVAGPTDQKYSLIRCRLETGRTHQIRIHLSEAGHMLCGDKIYFRNALGALSLDPSRAPRHALHSDSLAFTHPFTGQHLKFTMPLPADLASWLKQLRGEG